MKAEIIHIVILSKNRQLAEKFKYALNSESKYFKQQTKIVEEIEDFEKVDILIVIADEQINWKFIEDNKVVFKDQAKRSIIIDMQSRIIVRDNITKFLSDSEDDKSLAFSILYNYYIDLKKNKERTQLSYNHKKLEKTMDKFEQGNNKMLILDKVDEVVMENKRNNSIGYEKLKIMIYFCIVNKLEIDSKKNYNYFHKAIARIFNDKVSVILNEINSTIHTIRRRKVHLKIQKDLEEMKGKLIIEQIILISKIVEKQLK